MIMFYDQKYLPHISYLKINIDISEDMNYFIWPILLSNIVNGVNLNQITLLQQVCDERGKKNNKIFKSNIFQS